MKTVNDAVVFNLKAAKGMLDGLTADLKGSDWEHRAVPRSNCAAWLVGHLVLTDRSVLKSLGVTDLPELPADFETHFSRENNAPHAESFGDPAILMPLFDGHRDLLIRTVAGLAGEKFEEPLPKPSSRASTVGERLIFMGIHVVIHAGQISTIRRSLGRPPLF